MNQDDTSFYLAVNNGLKPDSLATKGWLKSGAVCINKVKGLLKKMVFTSIACNLVIGLANLPLSIRV